MSAAGSLFARLHARVGQLLIEVELDVAAETLVLVGPNGAGKTSVLALLLGVLPVEKGRIEVGGALLLDTSTGADVPLEQRGLGYVPQDYALFPHLNVRRNVEFALASSATNEHASSARRAGEVLQDLGLEALAERDTAALSGGERQRVALARALSVRPRALLLDEPLAALDVHSRAEVRSFLAGYLGKLGLPTLVVTHDPRDARELGRRIAVLEAGRITQVGTWQELTARPQSPFVERFVAAHTT